MSFYEALKVLYARPGEWKMYLPHEPGWYEMSGETLVYVPHEGIEEDPLPILLSGDRMYSYQWDVQKIFREVG